jgi:hypothetical protein
MVMRILTNGCSFSRGPTAWPNHIAKWANADLINLAQAGAGNTYISRSTITELQKRSYDLVLIMWTGLERIDIQVEDIDLFDSTPNTSKYQSLQNDWPEKVVLPINDQDYVEKNWVFGVAHINGDSFISKTKLFEYQYKYQNFENHATRSFLDMLSLESYLQNRNIPYAFAFYKDYYKSILALVDQLDKSKIFTASNVFTIAQTINDWDPDGLHPGPLAQEVWASDFFKFIL